MAIYVTEDTFSNLDGDLRSFSRSIGFSGDDDVFGFTTTSGERLHIFLDNTSSGDIDIRLYGDYVINGGLDTVFDPELTSGRNSGSLDEVINHNTRNDSYTHSEYFAHVYGYSAPSYPLTYQISFANVSSRNITVSSSALNSGVNFNSFNQFRPYWEDTLSGSNTVDTFKLTTQSGLLGIYMAHFSPGANATINVFADSNSNGIFDFRDQLLRSETTQDFLNVQVNSGSTFIQIKNDTSNFSSYEITVGYDFLTNPVYRLLNRNNGAHLYTTSVYERDVVLQTLPNFQYEGVAMRAALAQNDALLTPVYRLLNRNNGAHLYTTDLNERNTVLRTLSNFRDEGIAYYVYPRDNQIQSLSGNTLPSDFELDEYENVIKETYRLYNRNNGAHLYTTSAYERDVVLQTLPNFQYEGVAFQANAYGL